jgi:hypothetical protein
MNSLRFKNEIVIRIAVPLMSQPKPLCLNMIVKYEMANLIRCVRVVADHIANGKQT